MKIPNINEYVGQVLRDWRRRKKFSLEELASRTGGRVSSRHIRRIETGQASGTCETLYCLRLALGITTAEMWMQPFLHEEQVPLYPGHPLGGSDRLSVNFAPGKTVARYVVRSDPLEYAIALQEDFGILASGSLIHVNPVAEVQTGNLVLAFGPDSTVKLIRWGQDPESDNHLANPIVHRVILIAPK